MTDIAYIYRAMWTVEDPDRQLSQLIVEARADLEVMAAGDGARPVGNPEFLLAGDMLVCEVPAIPLPQPEPSEIDEARVFRACRGERIELNRAEVLAAVDKLQREHPEMTAKDIAARLRRSASSLRKIRERARQQAPS